MKLSEARIRQIIDESVKKVLNEAFNSNTLRDWFKQHGGVDKQYRQDGLGDVTDDQIAYTKQYNTRREACDFLWNIRRDPKYANYFKTVYTANDGTALVAFFPNDKVETGVSWGGKHFKKLNDRIWRDEHDPHAKSQKNDVYYYGGQPHSMYGNVPANDFGLRTDADYKGRLKDLERAKQRFRDSYTPKPQKDERGKFKKFLGIGKPKEPSKKEIEAGIQKGDEEYNAWRQKELEHMKNYLNNNWRWHRRGIKDGPRKW